MTKSLIFPLSFFSIALSMLIAANLAIASTPVLRYQEICQIVTNNFYKPDIIEKKFPDIKKNYSTKIAQVTNRSEFSAVINEMLGQLKTSHTYYLTPSDYEYYHLGAVFSKIPDIARVFGNREVKYPTVGIITEKIDGSYFIACVLAGSAAEKSGLICGDEIHSVNGMPYSPIESIEKHIGKKVIFSVRRSQNSALLEIPVHPVLINPKKEMLEAEKASVRIIEQEGKKIGYIHIYSYAGMEYHNELVAAISWGKLKDADALIIDLRYGLGGAGPQYLNIFNPDIPIFQTVNRDGKKQTFDSQWRKPAVYLTNKATRSGKELVVFGAKKYRYATVIGEKTAGAATAGRLFPLSNNDLMYLAVKGSEVDGINLEGRGVRPDIEVPRDIRYCQGKDIQMEKSIDYLVKKLAKEG